MRKHPVPRPFVRSPLWYKDAVIYQLHVRAFFDGNNDGVGDFQGLVQKLDYLQGLGVNTIWLLPFYPSPLKDDGYDIADYRQINPSYGDLHDFRVFLREAHARDLRVVTELVINHTSDQHEWFQKSRRAPEGSYWRNFYVWSDNPQKYKSARIIFRDFEPSNWTFDPVAKSYFWHRFFSHQPDLNFDNPEVQKKIFQLVDYWMKIGVDGLRLDAVPYLFEREGTSCENLPETHEFLKSLRAYLDSRYDNRMLLAEANQWPEDAAAYFGKGDECHMSFHFPIMPRLFMAVKMEDRFSIVDIMNQTPGIPENCQWATFLRNHDELTLEMVTDEERDYMYNVYAHDLRARINLGIRRRLAPLLGNDRRQIELLNGLLFSLPGTPIIYYGDEIGMGDNIYLGDRNGVRTPFQWSPDRNAGFSKADPQKLYMPVIATPEYHYMAVNVENQQDNSSSLLRWMKDLIELRRENVALTRGKLVFLEPDNQRVLAFIREYKDPDGKNGQIVLVLANLSKRAQHAALDLSAYAGRTPVELRGDTTFPVLTKDPYVVMLGPYDFYWFALAETGTLSGARWLLRDSRKLTHLPRLSDFLTRSDLSHHFESLIAAWLPRARWFSGKDHVIRRVVIRDVLEISGDGETDGAGLVFADVHYRDQKDKIDTYLLTVAAAEDDVAEKIKREMPDLVIGEYELESGKLGIYHDAIVDPAFGGNLLSMLLKRQERTGHFGFMTSHMFMPVKREWLTAMPGPQIMGLEQSNSSMCFGSQFFFKLFRHLDEGQNPEVEIGQHLNKSPARPTPFLAGYLSYALAGKVYSLGALHEFLESQGSAVNLFERHLDDFVAQVSGQDVKEAEALLRQSPDILRLKAEMLPAWMIAASREAAASMQLLGKRTGELHRILAEDGGNPDFRPEDITPFYLRSRYQSLRNRATATRRMLEEEMQHAPTPVKALIGDLLRQWAVIETQFSMLRQKNFGGRIIRIHGDYHLGQVVWTGKDFRILDFEGEPKKQISARRLKHSPLQDVAGMLRSIDYLVFSRLREGSADAVSLLPWLKLWGKWMDRNFLSGYLAVCVESGLLPDTEDDIRYFTETLMLEKALYEITYELGSRPDWVSIPLSGLLNALPGLSASRGPSS